MRYLIVVYREEEEGEQGRLVRYLIVVCREEEEEGLWAGIYRGAGGRIFILRTRMNIVFIRR